jgi:hypothetical protein
MPTFVFGPIPVRRAANPGDLHGGDRRSVSPPGARTPAVTPPPPKGPMAAASRGAAVTATIRRRCRYCSALVMLCADPRGRVIAVDLVAVLGGELIINPDNGRIVATRSRREASAAARYGETGFVPHRRVCPAEGNRTTDEPRGPRLS